MVASLFLSLALGYAAFQAAFPNRHLKPPPNPTTVLAKVNGVAITAGDALAYLWEWRGDDVLKEMIAYRIAADEAAKLGVSVSDAEVDRAVDRILKAERETLAPGERLEDSLLARGFTRSRWFVRTRSELLLDRICLKSLDPKAWIRVSAMVFVPTIAGEAGTNVAEAAANQAIARLRQGVAWSTVFREDARDLRPRFGLEDWWTIAFFPEDARRKLGEAGVGGVVGPIRTGRGVEVFRVEGLGESAQGDERALLEHAHLRRNRDALIERLRREHKVEREWLPSVTG